MSAARDESIGLEWTGHPLLDAGVAGLTVFATKRKPEQVTADDLERFASWAREAYFTKELTAWISVVFTSNFLNPSFPLERKRGELEAIVGSYRLDGPAVAARCAFFARPAERLVARDLVPMLTGREPANFFADGQPGLPVSGLAVTALQGLALAAPLVGGKALVLSADDPRLMLGIVGKWQERIRQRADLSSKTGEKLPIWGSPRTRFVETLLELLQDDRTLAPYGSVTLYHASNSGQGPDIAIHRLDAPALRFVQVAQSAGLRGAWARVSEPLWREADKTKDERFARRNALYEALFELPGNASGFVRRFFRGPVFSSLRPAQQAPPQKKAKKGSSPSEPAPLFTLTPASTPPAPLWPLVEVFLEEVLAMERVRIEAIRTLGDRLAEAVAEDNDRRLFSRVYEARFFPQVRQLLIAFSRSRLLKGQPPGVGFDEFLTIFEEGEELARADFRLAWDLARIRMIESLHERRWFDRNKDALESLPEPEFEDDTRKETN